MSGASIGETELTTKVLVVEKDVWRILLPADCTEIVRDLSAARCERGNARFRLMDSEAIKNVVASLY